MVSALPSPRDLRTRIPLQKSTRKKDSSQQRQQQSTIDKRDQRARHLLKHGKTLAAKKAACCGRAEVVLRYGCGLEDVRTYHCIGEGCAEPCCSSRRSRRNTRDDYRLLEVVIPEARERGNIVGLGTLTTPRPRDLDEVRHAILVAERAKIFYAWAIKKGHLVGAKRRGEISCETCFAHSHGAWAVRSRRSLKAMRAKWVEMNPGCIAKYAFDFREVDQHGNEWDAASLAGYPNKGAVANGVRKLSTAKYAVYLDVVFAFPSLTATLGAFRAERSESPKASQWEHYVDRHGKRRRRRAKPPTKTRRKPRDANVSIKTVIAAEVTSQNAKYVDAGGLTHHVDHARARVRWIDGVAPEIVQELEAREMPCCPVADTRGMVRLAMAALPLAHRLLLAEAFLNGVKPAQMDREADVYRLNLDPSFS